MDKLISHESPLCLLEQSRVYNDYDYALVHLFEEIPEYFNFFKESLEQGRKVILDNSIFELGVSFDPNKFANWIQELNPTEYIIPDVLEDSEQTIDSLYKWMDNYGDLPGKRIGVIQGKNYGELIECYEAMDEYCDKIAISFDYSYYNEKSGSGNKLLDWMVGRMMLINDLLNDSVINLEKPHHLLGCSLPQEFSFYKSSVYDFIESIDTSNPIVHGIKNIKYSSTGLWDKESVKLFELIHTELNDRQLNDIYYNIREFRRIVNE